MISLEIISWQSDYLTSFRRSFTPSETQLKVRILQYPSTPRLLSRTPTVGFRLTFCVIPSLNYQVLEYKPVSHQLRISASP